MSFDRAKLTELRGQMSQTELGRLTGLGQQSISNWESGKTEPKYSAVVKLCEFFGVPLEAFRGGLGDGRAATHAPEAVAAV